jgi:hypothetical protein
MKLSVFAICLLCSSHAVAEWEWVGESNTSNFYVDLATVSKNGSLLQVWQMEDFKQRGTEGLMSRSSRAEYDCQTERYRYLFQILYSKPMGRGKPRTIRHKGSPLWLGITSNSAAEVTLQTVCPE